jgi:hypothetical protein
LQYGFGAGWGFPVVTAWFKINEQVRAPGPPPGFLKRLNFGVGIPGFFMIALPHHAATFHQHHAHHGVGAGSAPAFTGQLKRTQNISLLSFFIQSHVLSLNPVAGLQGITLKIFFRQTV